MAESDQADLTTLTVELLSAFVSNNTIESGELAGLIQSTHSALAGINAPPPAEPPAPEFEPAVSVRKSLGSRDHILSLIDGKPYKTLKRHLSGHGLTPAEYRERYKLAADYPMVAPTYSEHRRDVAQRLGLGRKPQKAPASEDAVADKPAAPAAEPTPPVAPEAKALRKAAPKRAAAKIAAKASKVAEQPAPTASTPVTAQLDTPAADESVDSTAAVLPKPKSARKAATPKPVTAKAKRAVPTASKPELRSAPAKRGKSKAANTSEQAG